MFHRHPIRKSALFLISALVIACPSIASAHDPSHAAPDNGSASQSNLAGEAPFLTENDAAMTKMMTDMVVKPTGDADRDFVAMMVPHHQGAIDMALAVLRYGHNEQLKRLAQEIIVTQQQEIAAMRLAVGEPLPASTPSPTQPEATPVSTDRSKPHDSMMMMSPNMNMNMK